MHVDWGSSSFTERKTVSQGKTTRYTRPVTVNPVTRRENRILAKAQQRPKSMQALFLRVHGRVMATVRGQTSVWPGSFVPGFSPRVQSATHTREKVSGGSLLDKGADSMSHPAPVAPIFCPIPAYTLSPSSPALEVAHV